MDVMSKVETGAIMAVVKILKVDGTTTPPFLTVLGLPTTALESSKAEIVAEEMIPNPGVMDPWEVGLPQKCRPIVVTTLTNTRDLLPAAIKLKIWTGSDSTLIFLKGKEVVKPLLFEETEENKPASEDYLSQCFLGCKEDFCDRIQASTTPPKKFEIPYEAEPGAEPPEKAVGCWYGAPVLFLPPVHNLPLGFVMDPKRAKSGKDIKEAIMTFFEIPEGDTTYNFLQTPYINSWCRTMANAPEEFAQTAVSLKQVKESWMMIVQHKEVANIAHAHQATFAHMECMLMHRIFRDGLIAGATKAWFQKLQKHEEVLKKIFDKPECEEDEDQRPPLGNVEISMQAYAYYLVGPARKTWDSQRGFAEMRGSLPAPNLARRFAYMPTPLTLEDVTEETRLKIRKDPPNRPETGGVTGSVATGVPETVNVENDLEEDMQANMYDFLKDYSQHSQQVPDEGSPLTVKSGSMNKKIPKKKRKTPVVGTEDSENEGFKTPSPKKKKASKKEKSKQATESPTLSVQGADSESAEVRYVGKKEATKGTTTVTGASPFKPSIHTEGDIVLKDQWKTPAALQASLQHHVMGPQALKIQDLVANTTAGEDQERDDYFTSADMLANKHFKRAVKVTAHLLAHCLPESAATKLKPKLAPTKRIDISFLMHPGNMGGEYYTNVVGGKIKDLKQTAGTYLLDKMKEIKRSPLPGQPDFQPNFFKSDHILKPLRAGAFGTGENITEMDDLDTAFTPFHLIASIDTGEVNDFQLPVKGLRTTPMIKIICNFFALFHVMAEDEEHYPNLPMGTSTFSLFSPLGGALCQAMQHLQKPSIAAAWDALYDKHGTITQKVKLLYMLGALVELFTTWANTRPTAIHYQVTTAGWGPDWDKQISLLGTELHHRDEKNLRLEIEAWVKKLKKAFGAATLDSERNTPVLTHRNDPPAPCKPKNYAAANRAAGHFDEVAGAQHQQRRVKIKQEDQTPGRRQGNNAAAAGGGHRNDSRSNQQTGAQKSKLFATPRLINFSSTYTKHAAEGKKESVGKILVDMRTANNLEFPKLGEKQICFPFVMEQGCDECYARHGPRKGDLCSTHREHVSLQGGTSTYTKAELQPLYKYLQNEHVAKQLVPTAEFKKFMN